MNPEYKGTKNTKRAIKSFALRRLSAQQLISTAENGGQSGKKKTTEAQSEDVAVRQPMAQGGH
jgi:hypothetical protein